MAYKDLQDYMAAIEAKGQLKRISVEVDPELEITEIADRVMRSERRGACPSVREGKRLQVAPADQRDGLRIQRMAMAFGAPSLDAKAAEIEDLISWAWKQVKGFNIFSSIPGALPKLPVALSLLPKRVSRPKCQEVVADTEGRLDSLPVLKCWPKDGGRFLTLPLVCTKDPETGVQNLGMYRMQVYDDRTAGMHWHLHKDGAHFFQKYKERGQRMPVAVALGCDPAVTYASTAPLPEGVWEMFFAGFLRGKSAEIAKATLSDLDVPADAEFVLEGYVDPTKPDRRPLRRPYRLLFLEDEYPVFHLERITRRRNPVYPATIVGIPPKEDCWMAKATERLFLPLLKQVCPEIVNLHMPLEGVFHNCVIVSIKKRFPGQARKVMNFMWGMGQMMYTKMIIVVDADVDPSDVSTVALKAFNNIDAKRDLSSATAPWMPLTIHPPAALRHPPGHRRHPQRPGRRPQPPLAGCT
jgi:4-hydroxy-3-polyprenylbenzoate decarboxylase